MKTRFLVFAIEALSFSIAVTGCASLHAELPSSRFESPETNGLTHRFQLAAQAVAAQDDTFTSDASARPPDFSRADVSNDTLAGAAASFGVFNKLDLGLRTTLGPTPYVFVVKYQILGPSSSEAKDGDLSLAMTLSAGGGERGKSGDQSGTFGPGGHNWSGVVKNTMTDIALIIGQRVNATTLLYGGGFYSNYAINATLDQSKSDDGLSPAASYSIETTGYQRGANVGFQFFFNAPTYVQLEGVYSDTHASNQNHSALRATAALGAYF